MQTTIAQYPRGMKSSWRHLTSFKGSVSSVWAAASPGDHRTTTERATTQRSCWVERPVESHHRQIFFLYVNWTLILVATPHEESLIWPHFPSPNLLPPYKPPSPEPLTSWPWAAKLGTLLWGATSKIPQTTVLSWAEPSREPHVAGVEVTSTWWRADLRPGWRGAGNLHRPLLQFSDWDPVCEPWCEHVDSGAATRVSRGRPGTFEFACPVSSAWAGTGAKFTHAAVMTCFSWGQLVTPECATHRTRGLYSSNIRLLYYVFFSPSNHQHSLWMLNFYNILILNSSFFLLFWWNYYTSLIGTMKP